MGFFDRAYSAAADQYGRDRSEKYGRVARFIRGFQIIVGIAFILGIVYMWNVGH